MNFLYTVIFTLIVIIGVSCTEKNQYIPDDVFSIKIGSNVMKIYDTIDISLEISGEYNINPSVEWSASPGSILHTGSIVKFVAPEKSCIVSLEARIALKESIIIKTTDILVYSQLVILKADDMICDGNNEVSPAWRKFTDYIISKKIKTSIGLIGNSLESGNEAYFAYLKSLSVSGIELWNHGYDHEIRYLEGSGYTWEFKNKPYEYQKEHLNKTQLLAYTTLGLILHTFGAPANALDSTTLKLINETADIKVWFFGMKTDSKLVILRNIELEYPTGKPDFEKFVVNYRSDYDCIPVQIHPNSWTDSSFSEFEKMTDFLIGKGVTFINPYEYYILLNSF
ncbi:MAG: DUF2334 domain-containing protein [Ignavibacteriaceae bacterium]|jgi:hypothetical protein|nr:DUF2334 domain-containing protein [Ignavibacteriaceae bacterium]